ncbi:MAG: type I secretion system permease/ATPase [Pseudomonadota bacterium]
MPASARASAPSSKRRLGSDQLDPIARMMRRFRLVFIIVFIFSLVVNLLALVSPFYMLQVYDRVLTSGSLDTLYALTALAFALLAINGLLELARTRLMTRLGNRLEADLGPDVFSAAFRRRVERPEAGGGHALRDLDQIKGFMTGPGYLAFFDAPWIPAYLALIFLFHPLLGAIALAGAMTLFLVAVAGELLTRGPVRRAADESRAAYRFVEQALRNAEAAQAMGMQTALRERWREQSLGGAIQSSQGADRSGVLNAMAKAIRPSLQVAILGAGAYLAVRQIVSPGVMIAASIVMGRALAPVEAAIAHWRNFVAARAARSRLEDLFERYEAPEPRTALPAPAGRIAIEAATAAPPGGGQPVIVNASFSAEPGELLAVLGPSASGKSSLARLLVGVWRPSVGHVRLDGADLSDWDAAQLGRHIGYLPQDIELFEGTVAENIARFDRVDAGAVVRAASLAGAHEAILALPEAYDTKLGEGGAVLSGGQRQRVALARALYGDPRLIVLDEPDANLDDVGRAALTAALSRLREAGRTVFLISHRVQGLGKADRVLLVERGRVRMMAPQARPEAVAASEPRIVELGPQGRRTDGGGER